MEQTSDMKRKVDAVWEFRPNAKPTNPVAFGFPASDPDDESQPVPFALQVWMSLHRDLLRGTGFWSTMLLIAANSKITADMVRSTFPAYDFLDVRNDKLVDLLLDEALPNDRHRLRHYLSHRWLGLSLITAVSSSRNGCLINRPFI